MIRNLNWYDGTIYIVYIYLDTKLSFEFIQILKPFKNEAIAVMVAKYISMRQISYRKKVFNIFLLPNKLKIFRREGFDEYLNMCADII